MKTTASSSSALKASRSRRLCLQDEDWVIKICAFDLMSEALKAFGIKKADVRILDTCPKVARHRAKQYGQSALGAVEHFLNGLQFIKDHDEREYAELLTVPDIDEGEALLYTAKPGTGEYLIATDDKRSLVSLANERACSMIRERLANRIVCVAQ